MRTSNLLASLPARSLTLAVLAAAAPLAACGDAGSPAPADVDAGAVTPDAPVAPDLAGRWKSACTPMSATQGFVLDFDLQAATWAVDYTVFGDAGCASPFLTVRIEGPYALTAPSAAVPGAWDARFGFTRKAITPHVDAAAQYLGSAGGCGLTGFAVGAARDVSVDGCPNLGQRPIGACDADYDLAKLDGATLTFGSRPADNDMCTPAKRPTALSQVSVTRH